MSSSSSPSGLGVYRAAAQKDAFKFRAYSRLAKISDARSRKANAIGNAVRSRDQGAFKALDVLVQAAREVQAQMLGTALQIKRLQREFAGLRAVYGKRQRQILDLKRRLSVNRGITNKLDRYKVLQRARQFAASGAAATAQSRVQSTRSAVPFPVRRPQQ